jgi:predicted amidohydrolase
LRVWEFGGVRFAVIICLDIEIPEISAKLRGRGVDVILVPSATETILGVERVDRCASARAVELGAIVGVCSPHRRHPLQPHRRERRPHRRLFSLAGSLPR